MRKVSGPRPGSERVYLPTAFGNVSESKPIRVTVRNPTEAEKRRFARGFRLAFSVGDIAALQSGSDDALDGVSMEQTGNDEWKLDALKSCVVEIENYVGADGKPIDTGERLYHHGEPEIVEDVAAEVMTAYSLTQAQKKTSDESSESKLSESAPSAGTAETASDEGLTSSAVAVPDNDSPMVTTSPRPD